MNLFIYLLGFYAAFNNSINERRLLIKVENNVAKGKKILLLSKCFQPMSAVYKWTFLQVGNQLTISSFILKLLKSMSCDMAFVWLQSRLFQFFISHTNPAGHYLMFFKQIGQSHVSTPCTFFFIYRNYEEFVLFL